MPSVRARLQEGTRDADVKAIVFGHGRRPSFPSSAARSRTST